MPISAKILNALADQTRLRLLKELVQRPGGVAELAIKLKITQPNASRHLKVLREAGIVEERRLGTRREQHIVEAHRLAGRKQGLEFGFCVLHFDQFEG